MRKSLVSASRAVHNMLESGTFGGEMHDAAALPQSVTLVPTRWSKLSYDMTDYGMRVNSTPIG